MGMWSSAVGLHIDDDDLISLNYLHHGAPKIWYIIHSSSYSKLEELVNELKLFSDVDSQCLSPMQHKSLLIQPSLLEQHSIEFYRMEQRLNELVVIFPGTYHFHFDTGFNLSETVKYALPSSLIFQRQSPRLCSCSPTVRLNRQFFTENLLAKFKSEHLSSTSVTYIDLTETNNTNTTDDVNSDDFQPELRLTSAQSEVTSNLLIDFACPWLSSTNSDVPVSTDLSSLFDHSGEHDPIWNIFEQLSTSCASESTRSQPHPLIYPSFRPSKSRRRFKRRRCYKCRRPGHLRNACPYADGSEKLPGPSSDWNRKYFQDQMASCYFPSIH